VGKKTNDFSCEPGTCHKGEPFIGTKLEAFSERQCPGGKSKGGRMRKGYKQDWDDKKSVGRSGADGKASFSWSPTAGLGKEHTKPSEKEERQGGSRGRRTQKRRMNRASPIQP